MDHASDADATATGAGRYGKPGQIGRGGSFMWLDEAAPGAAWEAAQAAAAKLADVEVEQRQQAVASGGRFGTAGQIGRGGSFMWLDNAAPGAAWVAAQAAAAAFEDQQHGGEATGALGRQHGGEATGALGRQHGGEATGAGRRRCPRGHPTRRGPASEDHWDCDGCGREIRQGQNHMRCAACDWDLCGQCADADGGVGGGGGGDMEGRPPATETKSKKNTKGKKSKLASRKATAVWAGC